MKTFPILLLGVAVFLVTGCFSPSPSNTVKQFYKAVEKGEIDRAMLYFSDEMIATFGKEKVKAGLAEQTKIISEQGGIKKFEILSEDIQGQVATLKVRMVFGNGDDGEEEVMLAKLNGKWKIQPNK